jgi:hypothetical protein
MTNQQESTYAVLVRSEEKSRGVLEIILYALSFLVRSSRSGNSRSNQ